MKFIILFLLSSTIYSQNINIKLGEEIGTVKISSCIGKLRTIATDKGTKFRVLVCKGYTPWSKRYNLIIRSPDGKYSTNTFITDLNRGKTVDFNNKKVLTVKNYRYVNIRYKIL